MLLLITLYIMIYLLISYVSVYIYPRSLLAVMRMIMGIALTLFIFSLLFSYHGTMKYWIPILVLCLFMNNEIAAYKQRFDDHKAKVILSIFSILFAVMIIVLTALYI